MVTTRTFRSGNSVAVRLPKALGVREGTQMRVREEQGRYILEPVTEEPKRIDLTGVTGSMPWLKPIERDKEEYDDLPRNWHLLGLNGR